MQKHSKDLKEKLDKHGVHLEGKNNKFYWNRESSQHPRNWKFWSKCHTSIVVIWLEAYMTAVSSAGTATSEEATKEYSTTMTVGYFCFVTIYLLGQAIGGIILAPISEVFGRRTIYIIGTLSFGLASVIIGVPHHLAAATVGRFFQGVAASIPATVAFGNFDDMYDASTRIWVVYWYTLFGMAGLALGPIYSSYVSHLLGWRWVYHISAMISAASAASCLMMKESNAKQLLQSKTSILRDETGNTDLEPDIDESHVVENSSIHTFVRTHIFRPLVFLVSEPLVTLCAILCSIAFSLLYAATESLSIIYMTPPFDRIFTSSTKASLPFLAILIGEIINILPRIYEHFYLQHRHKSHQRIRPESKIHSFAIACPALAIGLWILAWTVPDRVTNVPWPISMIGLICIGFAANDFSYVLFGYVTDSYGFYAASAVSAVSTARTLAAGIFPLFVTFMYKGIGNNFATTILAAVATLFCFTPWLFIRKGRSLRERSKYATKGSDCLPEENSHIQDNEDDEKKVNHNENHIDNNNDDDESKQTIVARGSSSGKDSDSINISRSKSRNKSKSKSKRKSNGIIILDMGTEARREQDPDSDGNNRSTLTNNHNATGLTQQQHHPPLPPNFSTTKPSDIEAYLRWI